MNAKQPSAEIAQWRAATNGHYSSPLRYPGGKQKLGAFFAKTLVENRVRNATFVEPFAGGAGAALYLLHLGAVSAVHLNDVDRAVFAFWYAVTRHNPRLRRDLSTIPITPAEWRRQKTIYRDRASAPLYELGLAALFLNRTNRSGILRAGMIGGNSQKGRWKLDARFDRNRVNERLERIGRFSPVIEVSNEDVRYTDDLSFGSGRRGFVYFDPPYVGKGQDLYVNHFSEDDHDDLCDRIQSIPSSVRWIVTYDDVPVIRTLYRGFVSRKIQLKYSADSYRDGSERMFFADGLSVPTLTEPRRALTIGRRNG
jgi:DNA adenine methylase